MRIRAHRSSVICVCYLTWLKSDECDRSFINVTHTFQTRDPLMINMKTMRASTSLFIILFLFSCCRIKPLIKHHLCTTSIINISLPMSYFKLKAVVQSQVKMCSPSVHQRWGWVCFFIRFVEMCLCISVSAMDALQWMGAVRMRVW